jgi:hypothetical protein
VSGTTSAKGERRLSGITDNVLRGHALELGLVDVKVAAVDEDGPGDCAWYGAQASGDGPAADRLARRAPKIPGATLAGVSDRGGGRPWKG